MGPDMRYTLLPILLLAACDKPPAPVAPAPAGAESPGLSMTATEIPFNGPVKGRQLILKGHGCKSIRVRLLHLESGNVHPLTEHTFERMEPAFEGALWLMAQDGEPFGQRGKVCYSLTHSLKAGSILTTSASPILFDGPYTISSEATETQSSFEAEKDHVIFRRMMSKAEGSQTFSSGDVAELTKQTLGKKLEILAVTLRWE